MHESRDSMIPTDWQLQCSKPQNRLAMLLKWMHWSDCSFLVGSAPYQKLVPAHKLILALGSPVFEKMFYGELAEQNKPIPVVDIKPEIFLIILKHIYSDDEKIESFDDSAQLIYAAKKYMLPYLKLNCFEYILSILKPENACQAYELACFYDEKNLKTKCIDIFSQQTGEVLNAKSFLEAKLSTVVELFSLNSLMISSELDLFNALVRYNAAMKINYANLKQNNEIREPEESVDNEEPMSDEQSTPEFSSSEDIAKTDNILAGPMTYLFNPWTLTRYFFTLLKTTLNISGEHSDEVKNSSQAVPQDIKEISSEAAVSTVAQGMGTTNEAESTFADAEEENTETEEMDELSVYPALAQIRFLTLTPESFARGPAISPLLQESEAFAIIMNIAQNYMVPMPTGFSTSRKPRTRIN